MKKSVLGCVFLVMALSTGAKGGEALEELRLKDKRTGDVYALSIENGMLNQRKISSCAQPVVKDVAANEKPRQVKVSNVEELTKAIAAAESNDEIRVAYGEYACNIELKKCPIRLVAESKVRPPVLRGVSKMMSVIQISDGAEGSLVSGFRITGGAGRASPSSYGHDYYGGGICCSVPATIDNCIIEGNGKGVPRRGSCTFGGGLLVGADPVVVKNCIFVDNFAWASGGAILVDGGKSRLIMSGSMVRGNESTDFFGYQGGVSLANGGRAELDGVVLCGNGGDQLGAFSRPYNRGTSAELRHCDIEGSPRACNIEKFKVIDKGE